MKATISVVTATFNAADVLPRLIESLVHQTDRDFEWVVADGGSTDGTLALLAAVQGLNLKVSSEPDFGIYDALNRAIKLSSGEYYLVAGADDRFSEDAVANFRAAIARSGADIVAARARYGDKIMQVKKGPPWLFAGFSFIASHTLATAIRKELHASFGYYSRLYPIAADQNFILKACRGGASRCEADFVAGEIGREGVSSIDRVGNATEVFRVQVASGRSLLVQTLLFLLRLLRSR